MIMGAFGNESYPQVSSSSAPSRFFVGLTRRGFFSQVGDFLEFEARLGNSLQRMLLALENLRMTMGSSSSEEDLESVQRLSEFRGQSVRPFAFSLLLLTALLCSTDRPLGELLRDNRDFRLTPSYQPRGGKTVESLTALGPDLAVSRIVCSPRCSPDADFPAFLQEPWLRTMSGAYLDIATLPPPSPTPPKSPASSRTESSPDLATVRSTLPSSSLVSELTFLLL